VPEVRLVNIYPRPKDWPLLLAIFKDRPKESRITSAGKKTPSTQEHIDFVGTLPYRYWYFISVNKRMVGELHVTFLNEIGLSLFEKERCRGYGADALRQFIAKHKPLPALTSRRRGEWLVNIAKGNILGKLFFSRMGFRPIQETWIYHG